MGKPPHGTGRVDTPQNGPAPTGTPADWRALDGMADVLANAWGCWAPTLTHDARRIAYVSDRRGKPELWVQMVEGTEPPTLIELSEDPVLMVRWSPDGKWLSCALATDGGVRSEVWVVRPDGSGARRLAGAPGHAILGPWARRGHLLVVTVRDDGPGLSSRCMLIDPDTGQIEQLASGGLVEVLDLSLDGRFALLRDGARGAHFCRLLDRHTDSVGEVLLEPYVGSTEAGFFRPPPGAEPAAMVAYVVTDAGLARRALVAVPLGVEGERGEAGTLAARLDAELELADADDLGRWVMLVWNAEGRSELELFDTTTGERRGLPNLPGDVVSGGALARDGSRAVLAIESPLFPARLWEIELASGRWRALTPAVLDEPGLIMPTLERLESHDGLVITGWLYRPPGTATRTGDDKTFAAVASGDEGTFAALASTAGSGPAAVLSIHGGPESQERPVFNPQHQMLAASGVVVFAPNIRGSSGFGRMFVHADDRFGRLDAIADVVACAGWLIARGLADPARVALSGRSYGGYVTLMGLTCYPEVFAAGVDICGMSDLLTFFRDTEPWIAAAAVTKYGDPVTDAVLLASISPLRHLERLQVPLLVVHGALDTNVPVSESHQVVAAARALQRDVHYLELEGEGHEYRHFTSRRMLLISVTRFVTDRLSVLDATPLETT